MMKLNGYIPLDPAPLKTLYQDNGLAMDLLDKCNSMTFRLIKGYGEGFFLFESSTLLLDPFADYNLELEITDTNDGSVQTAIVCLINMIKLEHPDQTIPHHVVVHVAEEKFLQQLTSVARNYNLTKRSTISATADPEFYAPDDEGQINLADLVEEISGVSIAYTGPTIIPLEVNIQGYSTFDAIELLAQAFCFYWTQKDGVIYFFSGDNDATPPYVELQDTRNTKLSARHRSISLVVPYISNGTQRNSRKAIDIYEGSQAGEAITHYNPFIPAYITKDEVEVFTDYTTDTANLLYDHFTGILRLLGTYWAYMKYDTSSMIAPYDSTCCYTVTFADYGSGPRTIYSSREYPFLHIPAPYTFDGTGGGDSVIAIYQLITGISAAYNNTATATVIASSDAATPGTITVVNKSGYRSFGGAGGIAAKVTVGGVVQWWILVQDEPADLLVTLDASGTSGHFGADPRDANATIRTTPSALALTQFPKGFIPSGLGTAIANTLNVFGIDNDQVELRFNPNTDAYYVARCIPKYQRLYWAELAEDKPLGLQQTVEVTPIAPLSDGDFPADTSASDFFDLALNAKNGDKCLIAFDPEANNYKIIAADHETTHWLGAMYESWDDARATFKVDFTKAYNGYDPATLVEIEVENRWNWQAATIGDKVNILYDPISGVWYPEEKECPDHLTAVYL